MNGCQGSRVSISVVVGRMIAVTLCGLMSACESPCGNRNFSWFQIRSSIIDESSDTQTDWAVTELALWGEVPVLLTRDTSSGTLDAYSLQLSLVTIREDE